MSQLPPDSSSTNTEVDHLDLIEDFLFSITTEPPEAQKQYLIEAIARLTEIMNDMKQT